MSARCDHPERLAAWCDALESGTYTRGVHYLVERDNDGVMSFCAEGVCADLLARESDRLRLVFHGITEDPHFEDPTTGVPFVSDALSEWLGIDNVSTPLDLTVCPAQVQARIVAVHPAVFTQHGATEPWRLNDLGVEWSAIADALRCHYSVDRHRVPGTAEHAAAVAVEAAHEAHPEEAEQWLPVVGWEGVYEVSDLGRVRGVDRYDSLDRFRPGQMLAPALDEGKYARVHLRRNGTGQTQRVHAMVLTAFRGPRPDGWDARHLDGNGHNNRLSNLVWGTRSENILDTVKHGTHAAARTEVCPRSHKLVAGNLDGSRLRRGERLCRACRNARGIAKRQAQRGEVPETVQAIADRLYSKAMGSEPVDLDAISSGLSAPLAPEHPDPRVTSPDSVRALAVAGVR